MTTPPGNNALRIFAAADLHGRMAYVDSLRETIASREVDVLVLAGDILHYGRGRDLLPALDALPIPVWIVRGNSDPAFLERWAAASRNVRSLHLTSMAMKGFHFVGVSGTLPIPFHSVTGWRERATLGRLAGGIHSRSILVAHPPPRGCRDKVMGRFHAGSRGLARLIANTAPPLALCGHIHEAAGVDRIGRTVVVNCAMGPRRLGALIVMDNRGGVTTELL